MNLSKCILFSFLALSATVSAQRERMNFDEGWQFHKGDIAMKRAVKGGMQGGLTDANVKRVEGEEVVIAYTDRNKVAEYNPKDWENVRIPHDWLVEEPFINDNNLGSQPGGNGFKPSGIGFYRKEFRIEKNDEGKRIWLDFDGIFRNSTVWVNGHLMGNQPSGYLPSHYDITDVVRYGDEGLNVVLVKVDATDFEGWWYEGCGIYRHVWLTKLAPLHIAQYGAFVTTPIVLEKEATFSSLNACEAKVHLDLDIVNETGKDFAIVCRVLDRNGNVASAKEANCNPNLRTYNADFVIPNPSLWSPETPYLYNMCVELKIEGKVVDNYTVRFGVRECMVTENGFVLNGKPYPLKGTANHQDHAGVGVAVPDKLIEYRIRLLKDMGSNAYRCAHHPPTPELLDICDSIGMLVMDENRYFSSSKDNLENIRTMVLRDRNHPCVFMWNLENEENLEGTVMGARILRTMNQAVKELDNTRQTTAAMNHGWNEGGYSDVPDVVGYNYGQRGMQYVKDKEQYPHRLMIASESTSYVATRGVNESDWERGHMSNFGMGVSWGLQPGEDWKHIIDYPYLSGTFVWTGFDYRGEPTPCSWPCINSHFGIMDVCGFPKDGYYGYKAAWTDTPIVHAYPHWNLEGHEGDSIRMGVYTNCDEIEMLVNGKSLGKKKAEPFIRTEYQAVYRPGKLEVRGYRNGKVIAREVTETTGDAYAITMKGNCEQLKADGNDVLVVNIALYDKKGRVVPTADNLVKFSVTGPAQIIGVGNGNPSSHEADHASQRHAFNGLCQVILQTTNEAGEIVLTATSDGLKSSTLKIQSK